MNMQNDIMLKAKKVTWSLKEYRDVVRLMETEFPEDERTSVWLLRLLNIRKDVHFRAYYDKQQFVGFSFVIVTKAMAFILYLVVKPDARSKGYGSRILEDVRAENIGCKLSLNMEPLDTAAENYEQRLRRYRFYQKNGFRETGYRLVEHQVVYTVMSDADCFDLAEFQKVLGKLTLGMIKTEIKCAEQVP